MQDSFDGVFRIDTPKSTRFAINFITSIGLGGLTDSLREYLKNMPRNLASTARLGALVQTLQAVAVLTAVTQIQVVIVIVILTLVPAARRSHGRRGKHSL